MQDLDLMPGGAPDLPRSPYNRPDLVRDARDAEADAAPIDWQGTIRKRLTVLGCVLLAWVIGIEARLVVMQVFQHDRWSAHPLNGDPPFLTLMNSPVRSLRF